ncbi:sialic acid-binding Ig-like lectin 15 isoform X2 [Hippoglossus stenolepis]|uniref:sialic acid-binding Ig-like lectin 15 isoform X2 n=1 Tax=Hippoglossus stenolepis TaxID=195615 RepID=UPI00159CABB4|nr:sialic acid-binding Ig-like lectin 15 isoform X2 [Hippoglossus stenolepis]
MTHFTELPLLPEDFSWFAMSPRMWRQNQRIFLILSVIFTGSCSDGWKMAVSPVVTASRGEDAVLSCSLTNSKQQQYSGKIHVKWFARESDSSPFFSCSVQNDSATQGLGDCSFSELKHSLTGDPRRGELSLLIRKVQLTDDGQYFCQVELDGKQRLTQKTQLLVPAEPQILSLVVVETPPASGSAPWRLQCEVEGNPLPKLVWLSASKLKLDDQGKTTESGRFRRIGEVPYLEGEELTCRAENSLGGAQRSYPPSQTLMITAVVCGLMGALLLLLLFIAGLVHCRRNRAPVDTVYENVVKGHRVRASDPPADGHSEIQLVYSVVDSPPAHQLVSSSCPPEPVVLYSPVNVQQINRECHV